MEVFRATVSVSELMRIAKESEEKNAKAADALKVGILALQEKGVWRPQPEFVPEVIERLLYALSKVQPGEPQ